MWFYLPFTITNIVVSGGEHMKTNKQRQDETNKTGWDNMRTQIN